MSGLTSIDMMAEVLSEMVPEIADPVACRRALAFAGYSEQEISIHLRGAQRIARQLRGEVADRLYARQLNAPQRRKRRHDG
jgi:hypothetical protein